MNLASAVGSQDATVKPFGDGYERDLYLSIQLVPRSKHTPARLQK